MIVKIIKDEVILIPAKTGREAYEIAKLYTNYADSIMIGDFKLK